MNKKGIIFTVFLFTFFNVAAFSQDCPVPESLQHTQCVGSFSARNRQELEEYQQTRGLENGKLKGLFINFDINTESLSIATPCRIVINTVTLSTTDGDICLTGLEGILVGQRSILDVPNEYDIKMNSDQHIAFHEKTVIKGGGVHIVSSADGGPESKITLGRETTVDAGALTIHSHYQVIIDADSKITVDDNINLLVGRLIHENTPSVSKQRSPTFHPVSFLRIAPRVHINAETATFSSQYHIGINRKVRIETNRLDIDSFGTSIDESAELIEHWPKSELHPKVTVAAEASENDPFTFTFDGTVESSSPESDLSTLWTFSDDMSQSAGPTKNPTATYSFLYPGKYRPTLTATDKSSRLSDTSFANVSVEMPPIQPSQTVTLFFRDESNGPQTVRGTLGHQSLTLTKSSPDPRMYYFTTPSTIFPGSYIFNIASFGYSSLVEVDTEVVTNNPSTIINTYLGSAQPSGPNSSGDAEGARRLLSAVRKKLSALNDEKKKTVVSIFKQIAAVKPTPNPSSENNRPSKAPVVPKTIPGRITSIPIEEIRHGEDSYNGQSYYANGIAYANLNFIEKKMDALLSVLEKSGTSTLASLLFSETPPNGDVLEALLSVYSFKTLPRSIIFEKYREINKEIRTRGVKVSNVHLKIRNWPPRTGHVYHSTKYLPLTFHHRSGVPFFIEQKAQLSTLSVSDRQKRQETSGLPRMERVLGKIAMLNGSLAMFAKILEEAKKILPKTVVENFANRREYPQIALPAKPIIISDNHEIIHDFISFQGSGVRLATLPVTHSDSVMDDGNIRGLDAISVEILTPDPNTPKGSEYDAKMPIVFHYNNGINHFTTTTTFTIRNPNNESPRVSAGTDPKTCIVEQRIKVNPTRTFFDNDLHHHNPFVGPDYYVLPKSLGRGDFIEIKAEGDYHPGGYVETENKFRTLFNEQRQDMITIFHGLKTYSDLGAKTKDYKMRSSVFDTPSDFELSFSGWKRIYLPDRERDPALRLLFSTKNFRDDDMDLSTPIPTETLPSGFALQCRRRIPSVPLKRGVTTLSLLEVYFDWLYFQSPTVLEHYAPNTSRYRLRERRRYENSFSVVLETMPFPPQLTAHFEGYQS